MAMKKTVAKKTTPPTEAVSTKTIPAKTTVKKKTAVKKKSVAVKKTAPKAAAGGSKDAKVLITHEQRHSLICETAYYLSLDQSIAGESCSLDNWLQAEQTVDRKYRVADK